MNEVMIIGIGVIVLGLIISMGLYYKLYYKSENRKFKIRIICFAVLLTFAVLGGFIAQTGANQNRLQFKENELALLQGGKSFLDFTDEDLTLFSTIKFRFLQEDEENVQIYYDTILDWSIDEYMVQNEHRKGLTRDDAKSFILKKWKTEREFNAEN